MKTKILGTIINPIGPDTATMEQRGALLFSDNGKIEYAGPLDDAPLDGDCRTIDHSGHLIIPGFVDAHCHVGQARAANIRYSQLLPWLEQVVFPLERKYTRQVAKHEAPVFFNQLISTGTTTAGTYVTVREDATDEVFEVAKKLGIRAIIGKVMMDQNSPNGLLEDTDESVEASIRLCEKWHNTENGRLRYAFTPRFALTCSEDLMKRAGIAARKYDAHCMTHVAENKDEIKRAQELFPSARSYLDIYRKAGLLFPGSILAHAIHMDSTDWNLVAKTGAGIAHCPTSNLLLESGILDLSWAIDRGIPVGLGSDIGAGSEPALANVAHSSVTSQSARKVLGHSYRKFSAQLALYLMTKGGAQALGLGETIGDLKSGKDADFLVIDPRPCLPLGEWNEELELEPLLWAIVLRFRPSTIKEVYVQGNRVFPF